MMKVDTEGNELNVIQGSLHYFSNRLIRNAIVCRTSVRNNSGLGIILVRPLKKPQKLSFRPKGRVFEIFNWVFLSFPLENFSGPAGIVPNSGEVTPGAGF
jgi:hypothetical protein